MVRSLAGKERVHRIPAGMEAVADDLSEHILKSESGPGYSGLPVVERRHAVVNVRHTSRTVRKGHSRLGTSRRRVTQRRYDPVLIQKPSQLISLIVFAGKRHYADQSLRSVKISLKLLEIRGYTELFRLRSLILLTEIRPFQMYAQYLRSRNAVPISPLLPRDFLDILQCLCQHLFRLRDRCGEKTGHTFADYVLHPVPEAFLLGIIRVETVRTVCVHIDEPGHDPQFSKVHVRRRASIGENRFDLPRLAANLDLRLHPLIQNPNSFALQYHDLLPLPHHI